MRLARPYIPLKVRLVVALRQIAERNKLKDWECIALAVFDEGTLAQRLAAALHILFATAAVELHHRPALVNRHRKRNGDYDPPANDPAHLVYLLKDDEHRIETYVRGIGAQLSDAGQRRKNKRMAKNRAKRPSDIAPRLRAAKRKWASRPFGKGRKFQQRRAT